MSEEGKKFQIVGNDISDGYHTFGELYEHRCLLYLNLCLLQPEKCAFKRDHETWFCLYMETDEGQISYHLPNRYLPVVRAKIREDANYEWDGHNSARVAGNLTFLATKLAGL